MKSASEANFKRDYQSHLKYLKLKGLQPKTIEAYSRAIRRIGDYFDQQITDLTEQQLTDYFSQLLESHSWSAVKLDLYGLKFFYQHVLHKPWGNVDLIKPPKTQRLPDIVSVDEARQLFQTTMRQVVAECGIKKDLSPRMQAQCTACDSQIFVPHSCGHRNCPHCQHHESQQWLERQLKKQLPVDYFLLTFTLPAELRALAWQHQRTLYALLIQCSWETLRTFSLNDKQLQGTPGAVAVLHTHSRRLDYHPHVHLATPAAAINARDRLWRTKTGKHKGKGLSGYLFNHKALAKVFRAKLLAAITQSGLTLPKGYPEKWVVDCKGIGRGEKALVYLGRYLYRGVIQEKDIIACDNSRITFRCQNSKTKRIETRKVSGATFLWLLLQHVLPKGFRRARNFGFLHPNSKRLIQLLHYLLKLDPSWSMA